MQKTSRVSEREGERFKIKYLFTQHKQHNNDYSDGFIEKLIFGGNTVKRMAKSQPTTTIKIREKLIS